LRSNLAASILEALTNADLISVPDRDKAVEALRLALVGASQNAIVPVAVKFLDANDVIDEIYGSDQELAGAIQSVLEAHDIGNA
jgi:hypothetical protein